MRQGTKVEFSGGALTLHPLTLIQIQELEGDLREMRTVNPSTVMAKDVNGRMAKIMAAAAKRAHPDITAEEILGMIDMQDVQEGLIQKAVSLLMGRSGLVEATPGDRPLESVVAPTESTGETSTPDSQPA